MKHIGVSLIALAALGACATQTATAPAAVSPQSAEEALSVYYRAIPTSELPSGPEILPLSTSEALTRVIVASCNDEEQPNPAMARIAEEDADLFLFIGDGGSGLPRMDDHGRAPDVGERLSRQPGGVHPGGNDGGDPHGVNV